MSEPWSGELLDSALVRSPTLALRVPPGPWGAWYVRHFRKVELPADATVYSGCAPVARVTVEQTRYQRYVRWTRSGSHGNPRFAATITAPSGQLLMRVQVMDRNLRAFDASGTEIGEVRNCSRAGKRGFDVQLFVPRTAIGTTGRRDEPLARAQGGRSRPPDFVVTAPDGSALAHASSPELYLRRLHLDTRAGGIVRVLCVAMVCSMAGPVWLDVRPSGE